MRRRGFLADGLHGRHVLMALMGFFGVMLIVNAIFTYYAIATFGGGDNAKPYQRGIRYNETIAASERQEARGWVGSVTYDTERNQLSLRVADRSGGLVQGMEFSGTLGRPATANDDIEIRLKETEPGIYTADAALSLGQWIVSAESRELAADREPLFRLKQRILVETAP